MQWNERELKRLEAMVGNIEKLGEAQRDVAEARLEKDHLVSASLQEKEILRSEVQELEVCLSVCLSVCLAGCLSVCLTVCLTV